MVLTILLFVAVVGGFLWLDLRQHNNGQVVSLKDAAIWSAIWVAVSLAFAGYLWVTKGSDQAGLFTAGYLLEKSLSVDNLFVFMAVFASFGIKDAKQHRILYYGILGALVFRLFFITIGASILMAGNLNPIVHMIVYVLFGGIVLYSALQMWKGSQEDEDEQEEDYKSHWSIKLAKNTLKLPVSTKLSGERFFVKQSGKWLVTPLFLCLLVIETSDIAFAFDSVPAVIAITKNPLLVYTSNIFAILGLRSMYFLLAAAKRYLCHLEKAVIGILVFIGLKLIIEAFHAPLSSALGFNVEIPVGVSLAVVVFGLVAGVVSSWIWPEEKESA